MTEKGMPTEFQFEVGKSYAIEYVMDWERKNAKVHTARVQILEVQSNYGFTTLITSRRPWNEGGTGQLDLRQVREAVEL